MYIVNQDGDQTIELHSVRYSCRWSQRYEEIKESIATNPYYVEVFDPVYSSRSNTMDIIKNQLKKWKRDHPYEEIVNIYVNGEQKFGSFYSRQRGIEEYKNILKALEDGVIVYQIPEKNEDDRVRT